MSLSKPSIIFMDSNSKKWDTYTKALVANALNKDTYMEEYKLQVIVTSITDHFYIKEKKDEALRTSESNEPTAEA
jgi:hypothetical protein